MGAIQEDYCSDSDSREEVNMENKGPIVAGPCTGDWISRSELCLQKRNAVQRVRDRKRSFKLMSFCLCKLLFYSVRKRVSAVLSARGCLFDL